MTSNDEGHRDWMRHQLDLAAQHFSLELSGHEVFGWRDRTIGCRANDGHADVWLRVSWACPQWAEGNYWTGNQDAATIKGVPKPEILGKYDWGGQRYRNRAEVMTLATDPTCSSSPELTAELDLPESWWKDLRGALDALAENNTDRRITDQGKVSRRLLAFYGSAVNSQVDRWTTAHGDLNWGNITAPQFMILDWESFGLAPAGYDAATLYVLSLGAPETARRLRRTFDELLASPDGVRSQLHIIGRYLKRVETGDFPEMADLWHAHARALVGVV